ncbi:hypothetical protein [Streptomyces mayteni]
MARLHTMEGRALARAGEETTANRAIETATECLSRDADGPSSVWISHFDEASLASETALCLRDLGRLPAAAESAERAVSLRTGDRARSRVFGQISLAVIRTEMGELEAACQVGGQLIASCRTLGSLRINQQLDELARALQPFGAERRVAQLLESLTVVNQQRNLLLAGIQSSHAGGVSS